MDVSLAARQFVNWSSNARGGRRWRDCVAEHGDTIEIDIPNRSINLVISDEAWQMLRHERRTAGNHQNHVNAK